MQWLFFSLFTFVEKGQQYLSSEEENSDQPDHVKRARRTFCTVISRINNASHTIGKDGKVSFSSICCWELLNSPVSFRLLFPFRAAVFMGWSFPSFSFSNIRALFSTFFRDNILYDSWSILKTHPVCSVVNFCLANQRPPVQTAVSNKGFTTCATQDDGVNSILVTFLTSNKRRVTSESALILRLSLDPVKNDSW